MGDSIRTLYESIASDHDATSVHVPRNGTVALSIKNRSLIQSMTISLRVVEWTRPELVIQSEAAIPRLVPGMMFEYWVTVENAGQSWLEGINASLFAPAGTSVESARDFLLDELQGGETMELHWSITCTSSGYKHLNITVASSNAGLHLLEKIVPVHPEGFLEMIGGGGVYALQRNVNFTLTCPDAIEYRTSNYNSYWTLWMEYQTEIEYWLLPGNAIRTLHVEFKDSGGLVSDTRRP